MPEKNIDVRNLFLSRLGKRVYEAKDVAVGDILGLAPSENQGPDKNEFTLNYVESVHQTPSFTKGDIFPHVRLKGPYIGLKVSESLELMGYKFLSMDQADSHGRFWTPPVKSTKVSKKDRVLQEELLPVLTDKGQAYVMQDPFYKSLGELLPIVELPSFSLYAQSRDLEDLVDLVKASKDTIEQLRKYHAELQKIFGSH